MSIFKVAVHTGENNNGFIQYDTDTKELVLHLNDPEKEKTGREYLTSMRDLHRYTGPGLSEVETVRAIPVESLETLKLALGYMWWATGIHIDWSRPAELY